MLSNTALIPVLMNSSEANGNIAVARTNRHGAIINVWIGRQFVALNSYSKRHPWRRHPKIKRGLAHQRANAIIDQVMGCPELDVIPTLATGAASYYA